MICHVVSKKLLLKKIKQGLGAISGAKILSILGFSSNQTFINLSSHDIYDLKVVSEYILRNVEVMDIKSVNIQLKINCNSYSGRRHLTKMPVRGQKTRTNASTRKKFNVI